MGILEGLAGIGAFMLVIGYIYNIEPLFKAGVGLIVFVIVASAIINASRR